MEIVHVDSINIDLTSDNAQKALTKMVTKLFSLWQLQTADRLDLLGLSPNSRALLAKYRKGEAKPESRDVLDRIGWLFSIHKALGLLYPQNEEIRYSWVSRRNAAFDNYTPLAVMKEQGLIGIAKVARYLDYYRGL